MAQGDARRHEMVRTQIAARGVSDEAVLRAMLEVPREAFVPPELEEFAYRDAPLPIACEQTISQPYVVALMVEALQIGAQDRVLEVGTGSGYAAAVLSRLATEVWSVERHEELAGSAARRLHALGYEGVHVRHGDGLLGWPEHAPYDAILVSASGPAIPPALLEQLAVGGRLVMPLGAPREAQTLVRVRRCADGTLEREDLSEVRFVPLVRGRAARSSDGDG